MRIQEKSIPFAILILVLMLSACSGNVPSPDASIVETTVCADSQQEKDTSLVYLSDSLSYPAEFGEPLLGEKVEVTSDISSAAEQISNVGDAICYLQAAGPYEKPLFVCNLFADLLRWDYDAVGLIHLSNKGNNYYLVYIQQNEVYYPLDPFVLAEGKTPWFYNADYDCIRSKDLDALCKKLRDTYPHNADNTKMTSCKTKTLSSLDNYEEIQKLAAKDALIKYITTPQYTENQILEWLAEDLTLEQWAEKITVPADAVQLLNAIHYREKTVNDNKAITDWTHQVVWGCLWNAQKVFESKSGNCGGTSQLMNALLAGDFDQQGYVQFSNNYGGHIFNYFVSDGIYVICDFIGIPNHTIFGGGTVYPADTRHYIVHVCYEPKEFGDWYLNNGFFAACFKDPSNEMYLYSLWMYPREGVAYPKGRDVSAKWNKFNNCVWDILPEQHKDEFIILFEHEDYPLRYLPMPDIQKWPKETR